MNRTVVRTRRQRNGARLAERHRSVLVCARLGRDLLGGNDHAAAAENCDDESCSLHESTVLGPRVNPPRRTRELDVIHLPRTT